MSENYPYGKISNPAQLGRWVRHKRKELVVDQVRAAGLAGVGVRFLSELERGKPTAELGKVLQVIERLGLELHLQARALGNDCP